MSPLKRGMRNNHYNKNLKSFAREHRNFSTKAEIRLWCELLRNKQMMGYPFLRQSGSGATTQSRGTTKLKLRIIPKLVFPESS